MKRSLLLISLFTGILFLSSHAQITITTADLPTIGLQVIRAVDNTTQISPGAPGLNQVWDFTNLVPSTYDTTQYLPPQGQPYHQNYPEAEVAIKHLNGGLQPYWDYEYARYDNQGMRYVGDEDMLTLFGEFTMTIHITSNPDPLGLKLPFTYGDTDFQQTTYEWLLSSHNAGVLMDSIKQISQMDVTTTGDASGIISTPFGSYQALRVKTDIVSHDSVFNWTPDGWVFDRFEVNNISNYKWYTNDYYEIGNYNIEEGKANSMTFFQSETIVGVPTLQTVNENFIYPNPANDQITISSNQTVNKVEIFDVAGHLQLKDSNSNILNISSLSTGLYIVKVTTAKGTSCNKLTKR